jgi:hypothetical protein
MQRERSFFVARATRDTERETASRAYTLAAAQVN